MRASDDARAVARLESGGRPHLRRLGRQQVRSQRFHFLNFPLILKKTTTRKAHILPGDHIQPILIHRKIHFLFRFQDVTLNFSLQSSVYRKKAL